MLTWTDHFEGWIIGRGQQVVTDGSVVGLCRAMRGWEATVVGTELYTAWVQIDRGRVTGLRCSCPYAQDGKNCKHMAAVFLTLEKRYPAVLRDDDRALTQQLESLSTDEAESTLQFAIDVNSTRCTALLLNHRRPAGQPVFSLDEFTLDDLPEDALQPAARETQGDNDPMKLLFPEEETGRTAACEEAPEC